MQLGSAPKIANAVRRLRSAPERRARSALTDTSNPRRRGAQRHCAVSEFRHARLGERRLFQLRRQPVRPAAGWTTWCRVSQRVRRESTAPSRHTCPMPVSRLRTTRSTDGRTTTPSPRPVSLVRVGHRRRGKHERRAGPAVGRHRRKTLTPTTTRRRTPRTSTARQWTSWAVEWLRGGAAMPRI